MATEPSSSYCRHSCDEDGKDTTSYIGLLLIENDGRKHPHDASSADSGDLLQVTEGILPKASSYVLDPSQKGLLIEDVWPGLFFGSERVPEIRRKIECLPWARDMFGTMIEESSTVLTRPPQLPPGRPGWRHDFYSPRTTEHLVYDPADGKRFLDPSDGSAVTGEAQEAAWILLTHERTYRLMRSMGLLYQLTHKRRYCDWVADGMTKAVDFFRRTPRNEGRHGALYFQPLYDAQVILLLSNSFGLTCSGPCYETGQKEDILRTIFEAGSRSLLTHQKASDTHNITCYVTAATGALGIILDRPGYVERALSEDHMGLRGLLVHGLRRDSEGRRDGFWFEGTTFYHLYAMCPLFYLFELAKASGMDRGSLSRARRDLVAMARAPTLLIDDRTHLPWLGDLGSPLFPGLRSYAHLYEYAAGALELAFSGTLSACLPRGERAGLTSLAFGPDHLAYDGIRNKSELLPASGIATLQASGKDGPFYVMFRSGRHGAGHDHLDKLEIIIHALGEVIAPDIGTAGYSLREFKTYCVSTFAHNTLMVDEGNQKRVDDAILEMIGPREVRGVIRDAYEGVVLERRVTLDPPRILVFDSFASSERRALGWVFHARGEIEVDVSESGSDFELPPLPEEGPMAFLSHRSTFRPVQGLKARWRVDENLCLSCEASWDKAFECTVGDTPSNPMTTRLGTLVMRSAGRKAEVRTEFTVYRT